MKIGFASADWSQTITDDNGFPSWGGSGWARLGQYVDLLPHTVVCGSLIHGKDERIFGVRTWDGQLHFDCDVVVMQRFMIDDVADKMLAARAAGQVLINDVDDWYWGLSPTNSAFASSHPKNAPQENTTHYRTILARSSALMVSTPYLADRLSSFAKCPIEVIPNFVDVARFSIRKPSTTRTPVVGWIGSTAHRSRDLEELRGIVGPMVAGGEIKLHHSGWHPQHPSFGDAIGVASDQITALPMVRSQDYPTLMRFDVGVCPLANVPFNQAKSWIKATEYAAAGIPFVASAVAPYVQLRDEYGIGRIAKRPIDWRKHLNALRDPDVRRAEAADNLAKLAPLDIAFGVELLDRYLTSWV